MKPPIVCICGSTRFKQAWIAENARLTGEGNIVLAVGLWGHHERVFPDEATKKKLDELHLRKIDLCDWVWVLDIGGYIGESTRNEIAYAEVHGKPVRYLSKEMPDYTEPIDLLRSRLSLAKKGFPMQDGPPIPWSLAEKIYAGYTAVFGGDQSLQRLADRGGFGWGEVRDLWTNTVTRDRFRSALKSAGPKEGEEKC